MESLDQEAYELTTQESKRALRRAQAYYTKRPSCVHHPQHYYCTPAEASNNHFNMIGGLPDEEADLLVELCPRRRSLHVVQHVRTKTFLSR